MPAHGSGSLRREAGEPPGERQLVSYIHTHRRAQFSPCVVWMARMEGVSKKEKPPYDGLPSIICRCVLVSLGAYQLLQ